VKIHFVAICGTGMGSLAGLCKEAGHQVSGSDKAFYPPMSESLKAWGIPTRKGFDPKHIENDTDIVVIGNACRSTNPEARRAFDLGLRINSFPQMVSNMFIGEKRSVMVAGTHGKTTTSGLLAFLLTKAGRDPGFLVGGIPLDFLKSFHQGTGSEFVVEGDEYDSAFFDKRPKFVHYKPHVVVLTSLEFDHADIYSDMDAYRSSFTQLVDMIPPQGLLVACADDDEVMAVTKGAKCKVISYGVSSKADWQAKDLQHGSAGTSFGLLSRKEENPQETLRVKIPLSGQHNVCNAVACFVVADHLGISAIRTAKLFVGFKGIARRMQVRGKANGITVIDDFAHHPTEVSETVMALRLRYPDSHLVAVFEPRTNTSRRKFFQESYPEAFHGADRVVIVPPYATQEIPLEERFSSRVLVEALKSKRMDAFLAQNADAAVAYLKKELPAGSVVLVMSNGAFDGIHEKMLAAFRARELAR
jgi:UDP-N-acetylmuramate: L-alanyl-gamma-D-glutamyl-meso-diaminopimelate ligase